VVCWGSNSSGQLGNGSSGGNSGGALVTVMTGGSSALVNPTALALGEWHTCALLASGGVACWGSDTSSQLGNAGGDSAIPAAVVNLTDAVEVAANRFYSCARRANGSVTCWGDWPGRTALSAITMVASGAAEIGAGYFHTCVRKTDGGAVCWGENHYGQIGNGATQGDVDPPVLTATAVQALGP
jgi:alpha-tubulin suppressor-like RCC1 family protein